MERFETQYPLDSRSKEIKQILQFVIHGQSCQLISVPGAGRSTVLRLLAYHPKLRDHHLKQLNNYLFVYINFAEIPGFETKELIKFIFLSLLTSIEDHELHKELYREFKEALALGDPLVLFQSLKKAITTLQQSNNVTMVLLFDRFSEFAEKTTSDFFSNLRALRIASGGKLAVVFSTHRALEDLLPPAHWQDFYEFFVGNHIFLDIYDKVATDFRIEVLEKEYGKKLDEKMKKEIVRLTGGHGKLMKLSTQILLSDPSEVKATPNYKLPPPKTGPPLAEITNYLLSHILIKGSLLEIWEALTREERQALREEKTSPSISNFQLPIPILTEFIKRNIPNTMVPKIIRFDEKTNEIYFGDEGVEGLTAQEFRLLKYLVQNPNRVCERDEIINAVWKDSKTQEGVSDEALDQVVHRARKKIEDEADNPKHLLTVKGRGFRFLP